MSAFYHGITKKVIVAFAALLSDIHIIRRKGDTVTGQIVQDIKVPISLASKDKWYEAVFTDPSREKQTKASLPKMAFEVTGFTFDATRKTTRSSTILCQSEDGTAETVFTPSPWNIEFTLYLVATSQEDIYQIMEQILPIFNPDYTVKVRLIPSMNIVQNIPISLQSIAIQDNYDGDYAGEQRLLVYNLNFLAKAYYYGEVKTTPIITTIETRIGSTEDTESTIYEYNSETGEVSTYVDTTISSGFLSGQETTTNSIPEVIVSENSH